MKPNEFVRLGELHKKTQWKLAELIEYDRLCRDFYKMSINTWRDEGHNEICAFCKKPCNSLAGNPLEWPLGFCHPDGTGKIQWHHTGCVQKKIF